MKNVVAIPVRTLSDLEKFKLSLFIVLWGYFEEIISCQGRRRGGLLDDIEDFFNGGHDEDDSGDQIIDEDEDDEEGELIEDEDDGSNEQPIIDEDDDDSYEPLPEDDGDFIGDKRPSPKL